MMRTPSVGGEQETVALPLVLVPFWLATLDASRMKEERSRDEVVAFQEEAAQALYDHFFGAPPAQRTDRIADLREIELATKLFGKEAGQQLYLKKGLERVPAMASAQPDLFGDT